jgi:5-(carboxyamino)imidazole ribonucleotide mutase
MEVLILLGSKSDMDKALPCIDTLKEFGVPYTLKIASAHRTPELVDKAIKDAEANGSKVIIAMAGMAAHLPGVVASKTLIPVIGVPISNKNLDGQDALYAIVQMPSGYPVATVAIDGAKNSALLAIQIIAQNNPNLKTKLQANRDKMKAEVMRANEELGL